MPAVLPSLWAITSHLWPGRCETTGETQISCEQTWGVGPALAGHTHPRVYNTHASSDGPCTNMQSQTYKLISSFIWSRVKWTGNGQFFCCFKLLFISEPESRDQTKTETRHKPPGSHFLLCQTKALRIIYMKRYIAVITKDERQPYSSRPSNAKQNNWGVGDMYATVHII